MQGGTSSRRSWRAATQLRLKTRFEAGLALKEPADHLGERTELPRSEGGTRGV